MESIQWLYEQLDWGQPQHEAGQERHPGFFWLAEYQLPHHHVRRTEGKVNFCSSGSFKPSSFPMPDGLWSLCSALSLYDSSGFQTSFPHWSQLYPTLYMTPQVWLVIKTLYLSWRRIQATLLQWLQRRAPGLVSATKIWLGLMKILFHKDFVSYI